MLSITSIKQKALILLNNLFSASAAQSKKAQQKMLLQLDELLHLKSLFTLSPNTKYSNNLHKYFPYITQIFFMLLGSHKYSLCKPHKLPWALSQILPIISHILSNLDFPQIIFITLLPKLGHKITLSTQKAQNHLTCGQSPKRPTKHLQSPLLHDTFTKPVTTGHL